MRKNKNRPLMVLVTGGGGFLGKAIVRRLVERGDRVRSFSRRFYPELEKLGVEQIQGDLNDSKAVRNSLKEIETKNHIQIAILSKDREDGRKDYVKLARSIGRVHIKHFSNYDEAITWLLGGKDIFT